MKENSSLNSNTEAKDHAEMRNTVEILRQAVIH